MMQGYLENAEPRVVGLLLGAVLLLASAAQISYLLWPQFKAYQTERESHEVLQRVVSNSSGLDQQLQQAAAEVEQLRRNLHGDMTGLPANQMESYIIGRLQKVSWETGVELISVKPAIGKKVQMFQESLFEVVVHADYFDFFSWLQTISDDLGFIVVKHYEIRPLGEQLENPKLKIGLTMVSYRLVEE